MKWSHVRTLGTLVSAGLLVLTGCTTAHKASNRNWIDLFTPAPDQSITAGSADYGIDRVASDYAVLVSLTRELDALADEMAMMKRTLVFKENPYLSDVENKEAELLLFRFTNARAALWEILNYYRHGTSSDPDTHTKGAVLGMSAGLNLGCHSSRFAALFHDQKDLIKLINTAHPSYELPAGIYDAVSDSVTSIDHLELIDMAWYLFCKELADPKSRLAALQESDPLYRGLIAQMDGLHAFTHIQTEYILHARESSLPDLQNRLHHSRIAKLADAVSDDIGSGLYKTRGLVFKDVARIKRPRTHLLQFSDQQVRDIKASLQPGDILLTFSAGYMSNVFLPGMFKHGITYVGSVEDRRQAGLTDELLMRMAVSDLQGQKLIEHVNVTQTADGYNVDIVEAVAEGVVMHSLEKLLATHINRLVVIRPRLTGQERLTQLVALLQYVGTPYDFKFDFQDDTYQCCTEVVYRTTDGKGSIDFSLVEMKGMWILAADDILRYYLGHNPGGFELVMLADMSSEAGDYQAQILTGAEGLKAVYKLMDVQEPRGTDPDESL